MTPAEEHLALYSEIGLSITQWAHVEQALFEVVAAGCDSGARRALNREFFSIENFRARLSFADREMQKKARGTTAKDWERLRSRVDGAAANRNKLAHYRIIVFPGGTPGRRYAMVPWLLEEQKRTPPEGKPPAGALCLRDVIQFRYQFFALTMSLQNFRSRLVGRPEEFPKSTETPMPTPTIQRIRSVLYELLGQTTPR